MYIKYGDVIFFGVDFNVINLEVCVILGYIDGCVSYVCDNMVFMGDVLFICGCGWIDF